jgi:hypothetical protein
VLIHFHSFPGAAHPGQGVVAVGFFRDIGRPGVRAYVGFGRIAALEKEV